MDEGERSQLSKFPSDFTCIRSETRRSGPHSVASLDMGTPNDGSIRGRDLEAFGVT